MTYLNSYVIKMRMGGLSTSFTRTWEVLQEDYNIYKYHGLNAIKVVFLKKIIALKQYLKIKIPTLKNLGIILKYYC